MRGRPELASLGSVSQIDQGCLGLQALEASCNPGYLGPLVVHTHACQLPPPPPPPPAPAMNMDPSPPVFCTLITREFSCVYFGTKETGNLAAVEARKGSHVPTRSHWELVIAPVSPLLLSSYANLLDEWLLHQGGLSGAFLPPKDITEQGDS